MQPHPILLSTLCIHPTQNDRRFQCIHDIQVPYLNASFEGAHSTVVSRGDTVFVGVGLIGRNDIAKRKAKRKGREWNVMMDVEVRGLGVKDVDFEGGKVFFRLGNNHQCVSLSNSHIFQVVFVVFIVVFVIVQLIVHCHVLKVFHCIPLIVSSSLPSSNLTTANTQRSQTLHIQWHILTRIRNIIEIVFIFAVTFVIVSTIPVGRGGELLSHHFGILANQQVTNLLIVVVIV
mmetsp:Transcript_21871/g.47404  ORF Transcript_21871/g.47404 Transcript_21871/m.47404 type:complete len:232 (+) Transcript_21871:1008-1703(+)